MASTNDQRGQAQRTDRREALRRGGRVAALGALAATAGVLAARGQVGHEPCDRMHVCRGCGQVERCVLPQALSYRDVTRRRAT